MGLFIVTVATVDFTFDGVADADGTAAASVVPAAGVVGAGVDTLVLTGLSKPMFVTSIPASLAYLLMSLMI